MPPLADDDAHARLLDELVLELLHAHGGRGADGDDLEAFGAIGVVGQLSHDWPGVEDGGIADVDGQLAAQLHQSAVSHVAAGHEQAVEEDDVPDLDTLDVLGGDRCGEGLVHSSTPLWVRSS
jgi:hypothetical protein|nr:hypothetical protein [Propionibacterium freudenreichii]